LQVDFLDIDLQSEAGAALLEAVRKRHGDAIVYASRLCPRLFLMRSPLAPRLRAVGSQVGTVTGTPASSGQSFSSAGGGETVEDAFAACIGEYVERASCLEQDSDCERMVWDARVPPACMTAARELVHRLCQNKPAPSTSFAWMTAKLLADSVEVLVPADWCLGRASDEDLRMPGVSLSTGIAAGRTWEEAAVRALLELVERDAAALWWIGGRRGRQISAESRTMREASNLLSTLRVHSRRHSWLLDITTDLLVPCVAALSVAETGRDLCVGLAARHTLRDAARSAILEMCLMELGLALAQLKDVMNGTSAPTEVDRRHLARAAAIDAALCELLHPRGNPSGDRSLSNDPTYQLDALKHRFAECGVEAALVDLTRPQFNIPVVRAIAPRLQLMPGDLITARLADTIAVHGGGARWTGGAPLL
jgi:ribosomal protein S12 methylthiotransferase accessory factor